MLSQHRFNRFANGSEFMNKYGAKTVDDAFIRAITEPEFAT
jgi:ABC-2 type transport system ATP-binding protein